MIPTIKDVRYVMPGYVASGVESLGVSVVLSGALHPLSIFTSSSINSKYHVPTLAVEFHSADDCFRARSKDFFFVRMDNGESVFSVNSRVFKNREVLRDTCAALVPLITRNERDNGTAIPQERLVAWVDELEDFLARL